jgi:hypothetical protein
MSWELAQVFLTCGFVFLDPKLGAKYLVPFFLLWSKILLISLNKIVWQIFQKMIYAYLNFALNLVFIIDN